MDKPPSRPIKRYVELFGGASDGEIISFPATEPTPATHVSRHGEKYQLRITISGNLFTGATQVFHYYELCQTTSSNPPTS